MGEEITSSVGSDPGASQPGADRQYSSLVYAGMTTFTGGGAEAVS